MRFDSVSCNLKLKAVSESSEEERACIHPVMRPPELPSAKSVGSVQLITRLSYPRRDGAGWLLLWKPTSQKTQRRLSFAREKDGKSFLENR